MVLGEYLALDIEQEFASQAVAQAHRPGQALEDTEDKEIASFSVQLMNEASIFVLADPGGLKQVTRLSVPSNAWQEYVSESHFRQRYTSDESRCRRVHVANGGDTVGPVANICFQTGRDMGEVTCPR
jgi:hypothetical protein